MLYIALVRLKISFYQHKFDIDRHERYVICMFFFNSFFLFMINIYVLIFNFYIQSQIMRKCIKVFQTYPNRLRAKLSITLAVFASNPQISKMFSLL